MMELVGVTSVPRNFKRRLLVFDRIAFPFATATRSVAPDYDPDTADLDWLLRKGVVFDPSNEIHLPPAPPRASRSLALEPSPRVRSPDPAWIQRQREGWADASDWEARRWAVALRGHGLANAVPNTFGGVNVPASFAEDGSSRFKTEILEIVAKALPVPGDSHSLEDILGFRAGARVEGLTQGLRVWINEMASGKLTQVEVSDKLEDLVSRYERALKLERMQRDTGIIETLVVTTAEIAESLVKFQWSTAAKKLFEVRHRQIDLMKAEITLPGREVAYIVKARERFGG